MIEKNTVYNAVDRARQDLTNLRGKLMYYDQWCSDRHWAYSWAYNVREPTPTNSRCMINKLHNVNKFYESTKVTFWSLTLSNIFGNALGFNDKLDLVLREDQCFDFVNNVTKSYDNKASKMELTNKCVRVYMDNNCSGDNVCLCDNVQDFSTMRRDNFGGTWDDQISSISFCNYNDLIAAKLKIFEHERFMGRRQTILIGTNECRNVYIGDTMWKQVSSVVLAQGVCMRVWSENDCKGYFLDIREDIEDLQMKVWNDKILSFSDCNYERL